MLLMLLFYAVHTSGSAIDVNTAKLVATNFYKSKNITTDSTSFQLVYRGLSFDNIDTISAYFVFAKNEGGFVIVAAIDIVQPILAWSLEGSFDTSLIPSNLENWLSSYKRQVHYAIQHKIMPDENIQQLWKKLISGTLEKPSDKITSVSPLLQTHWNQNGYYNYMCPPDSKTHKKTLTGCVATVMSQIMKYWSWPIRGIGRHYYSDSLYGVQSVNFGNTSYDWAAMPYAINTNNKNVATIMYHAGVSVNMNYGVNSSSAYVLSKNCPIRNNAQFALINYFCYKQTMKGLYRKNYSDNDWMTILKTEISAGRPVIYDGANDSEGHSFIVDGFDDNNNFNINWGWGGLFDGYFSINNLVPDSINLMKNNEVLVGIEPDSSRMIVMDDSITTTTKVYQKQSFTLKAKVVNVNTQEFSGTIEAILISDYYNDYIDTQVANNIHINSGDSSNQTFNFEGKLPGSYHINLNFQNSSSDFVPVCNSADFENNTPIIIYGDSTLNQFTVFPNPVADVLFISLNNSNAYAYTLFDASGRNIVSGNIEYPISVLAIPIYNLGGGLIFVKLFTPTGVETKKVIIAR